MKIVNENGDEYVPSPREREMIDEALEQHRRGESVPLDEAMELARDRAKAWKKSGQTPA